MFPTALKWFQTFYAASFLLKNPQNTFKKFQCLAGPKPKLKKHEQNATSTLQQT